MDEKKIESLGHNPNFIEFLEEIYAVRESAIQQLHDRPSDSVQQIAGRILQCDDILTMGGWDEIEKRRRS